MRGSKCSANWSTSRPLLPCSHSLPGDDLARLLHSAQLILSQWNFWFLYGDYCHLTVPERGTKSCCSQTLGGRNLPNTGPRSAINAHAPPSRALLRRARADASASTRKYVASASEPQTCPHSRKEDTYCTQNKRMSSFSLLSS